MVSETVRNMAGIYCCYLEHTVSSFMNMPTLPIYTSVRPAETVVPGAVTLTMK
jgi:hypothetical protein